MKLRTTTWALLNLQLTSMHISYIPCRVMKFGAWIGSQRIWQAHLTATKVAIVTKAQSPWTTLLITFLDSGVPPRSTPLMQVACRTTPIMGATMNLPSLTILRGGNDAIMALWRKSHCLLTPPRVALDRAHRGMGPNSYNASVQWEGFETYKRIPLDCESRCLVVGAYAMATKLQFTQGYGTKLCIVLVVHT